MFICEECGKTYLDIKQKEIGSSFIGLKVYEPMRCDCGGEIEKAQECKKCGGWTSEYFDICLKCAEQYKNLETAIRMGKADEEKVSINHFLLHFFDKDDIENTLIEKLKSFEEENLKEEIENYINADKEWFWEVANKIWKEER
jgi:hypothetical protein